MLTKRLEESFAMLLVGDGLLRLLQPERHMRLWFCGPAWLRAYIAKFAEHPTFVRATGLARIGAGLWLAARLRPEDR